MSTHGFLILNFTFTFIMVYIVMNWELPDGKFALKSLHNKLENIKHYTEQKKWESFPVFYKNTYFNIKVERVKPIEGLNYNKIHYIDMIRASLASSLFFNKSNFFQFCHSFNCSRLGTAKLLCSFVYGIDNKNLLFFIYPIISS